MRNFKKSLYRLCVCVCAFSWLMGASSFCHAQELPTNPSATVDSPQPEQPQPINEKPANAPDAQQTGESNTAAETPQTSESNTASETPQTSESNTEPDAQPTNESAQQLAENANICNDTVISEANANIPKLTEKALNDLGFEVTKNADQFHVTPRTDAASRIQSLGQDEVIVQLLNLYQALSRRSAGSFEEHDETFDVFFDIPNDTISAHDKTIIWATVLPMLIAHANQSGDYLTAKKLNAAYRTLKLHWSNTRFDIICTQTDDISFANMQFPLTALTSGGPVDIHGGARCLQNNQSNIITDNPQTELSCTVIEAVSPVQQTALDEILVKTLWGLNQKDTEDIAVGMGEIQDNLKVWSQNEDLASKWDENWLDPQISAMMCRMMTIELKALELHRFVEISRLEHQIGQIFKGATFYKRLKLYLNCSTDPDADFAQAYAQQIQSYRSEFDWIIKHFSPKNRKKFDKAFQTWTRKISKAVEIHRRLLAGLVAWSEGNYAKATLYIGDITDKRSIISHPQLYSLNLLLQKKKKKTLSQETLAYYSRVMLLKMPALMYQTLTEAGRFLNKESRREVVAAVRQYTPSLVPHEIAKFYLAYENEFKSSMTPEQCISFDVWQDTMVSATESKAERDARLMRWYNDLLKSENWSGIVDLSSRITSDTAIDQQWRDIFTIASLQAQALAAQNPEISKQNDTTSLQPDTASCLSAKTSKLSGLEFSKAWLKRLPGCLK